MDGDTTPRHVESDRVVILPRSGSAERNQPRLAMPLFVDQSRSSTRMDHLIRFKAIAHSGRLGEPVFLRLQITCPPERAVAALAEGLAEATALFEDAPASVHVRGDETSGALHALLLYRSGSCLLAYTGPGEDAVDGLLLGNHGAAYRAGALGPPCPASGESGAGEASSEADQLAALIRQSLSTRQPVRLKAETDA